MRFEKLVFQDQVLLNLYKDTLPNIEYIWLIIDSFVYKETHFTSSKNIQTANYTMLLHR